MSVATESISLESFPVKVQVGELIVGRYADLPEGNTRPLIWENRIAGVDLVRLTDGRELKLVSDGQQSPPKKGWVLMLTDGSKDEGYHWTLYGMPKL